MNSFTLEASFNGYVDENWVTKEFHTSNFLEMGEVLGKTIH